MTDIDATRRRHRVADPLREFVGTYLMNNTTQENEQWLAMTGRSLLRIADQIDREHERRMDQAREDSRKATCNYMSRIIADYKRGKKWKRKEYPNG